MSSYIDKKFINMVSAQLEKFSWKKENLACCRCKMCGDSQKNKTKTRGYFYEKKNNFFYKCHNCGVGMNLYNFLKEVSPSLCKEYSLERYRNGENGKSNYKKPKVEEVFKFKDAKPKFKKKDKLLDSLMCLNNLPKDHTAVQFANMRKIPKQFFKLLYYTDDFTTFAGKLDKDTILFGKEERLVIPFFNSHGDVVGCQGRALVGASSYKSIPTHLRNSELVFVMDNEPRNLQVCNYNEDIIEMGHHKVMIWPENIQEKDLNDLAFRISTRKIQKMIDDNTYTGLEAKLHLRLNIRS